MSIEQILQLVVGLDDGAFTVAMTYILLDFVFKVGATVTIVLFIKWILFKEFK